MLMSEKPKKFFYKKKAKKPFNEDEIKVYILSINQRSATAKTTWRLYKENGFSPSYIMGTVLDDPKRKSKIVMESWTNTFSKNPNPKSYSNNRPVLFSEDDVAQNYTPKYVKELQAKYPNKVVWLCYQRTFKEKGQDIPVGAQVFMIPNEKVYNEFRDLIMKAKPIHFDRWMSRQELVVRPTKPKDMCAEITSQSATLGKVRKGEELDKVLDKRNLKLKKEEQPNKKIKFIIQKKKT